MALLMDANGEEISVGSPAIFDNLAAWTAMAWIKATSGSVVRRIFDKMYDGTTQVGWELYHEADQDMVFQVKWSGATAKWQPTSLNMPQDSWFHCALSYDGGSDANDPILYWDAVSVPLTENTAPSGSLTADAAAELTFGNINHGTVDGERPINGSMAEIAAYNVILTPGEIVGAMWHGPPSRGRIGYWPCRDSGVDLSGNKNNATISTVTVVNHAPVIPYSAQFWGHGPLVEVSVGGIDYTLAAEAGAFVLTGIAAGLVKGYVLPAAPGAHSMSGTPASLVLGRKIAADGGAFTMAGQDAALTWAAALGAAAGSFDLAGQDADLILGYVLAAIAGAYDLAGQDAGLATGQSIAADGGAFDLAGSDADLILGLNMAADAGAFDMAGADAGLRWAAKLVAEAGAYTFEGQDVDLLHTIAALAAVLFPPHVVDASPRRWKVDAERTWKIDAPGRRFRVDDDL